MSERGVPGRRRQVWTVILVLAAIGVLALAVHECYTIYYAGRHLQDAVDGATLAGAMQLARALQEPGVGEDRIVTDMVRFARLHGLDDKDLFVGYYLDAEGHSLGLVGSGIPQEPRGLEPVVSVRVPTFLTRIFDLDGRSLTRQSRISFEVENAGDQGAPRVYFDFNIDPIRR